ncbi:MAG TPA: gephyrin-like molybdotransferase Glp [Candidatus Binataceae bacterium]|jgi:molybdopterin molybdotransferase|nr:gephyrin-like molybdotransferase Glp [Candidatus Binataceae bacterium]
MISADEALAQVLGSVARLGVERIPLRHALGRILAEEIRSTRDMPGFDNSAMDGYAVRAADVAGAGERTPKRLKVMETVAAGSMPSVQVKAGEAVRIMTGAPVPQGADSIVPVERTRSSDGMVEIMAEPAPGEFVRPSGEDLRTGELVMESGKRLSPLDIGMLASLNHAMVDVWRRPRVSIVGTGDELVDVDQVPSGAQVVNSSAYALAAAVEECGGEAVILKVARDTTDEIRARLAEGAAMDAMLSTGGVSAGDFDHVKAILDELGMRTLFHGVAQKPGRPLKYGLIGQRPVFGLPGNPVSTMVCFYLYVRPALLKMGGHSELGLPRVTARCAADIKTANNLTEFVRVKLERRGGEFHALPAGRQGSNILSGLSRADGLLIGPAGETVLKAGFQATVLLLAPLAAEAEAGFEEFQRFH